jgi:hypothetical protein
MATRHNIRICKLLGERREQMARYIDTDYLDELITQLNNEGRGITRKEYKMIDSILFEFPTANVVDKERYDRLLENATIISEALNKYQSADMVEVVRCFECKYHYKDGDNVVTSHCLLNHNHVQPSDWFCADGERKETEDEEK